MIILKNKDFNVLKEEIKTVCNILNPYQQTKPATPQEMQIQYIITTILVRVNLKVLPILIWIMEKWT